MKKLSILAVVALAVVSMAVTSCNSRKSANLKSGIDSVSYAIGVLNGGGFKNSLESFPGKDPIDVDLLLAGFEQALKGQDAALKMTAEEAQAFVQTYFTELQEREANESKEEGEAFLAENKTKSGVITTESGLQYKVEKQGDGAHPTLEDRVKVHYTGTLLDGTVFDSTLERGEPATFGVGQVIPGWTEGLQIMTVGSKYTFWIPSDLAYGERGSGATIKPNSMLKFEIELLEIVK